MIGPQEGVLLGANLGRAIATNADLLSQRRSPLPKFTVAHSAHCNFKIQTAFRNASDILKPDRKLVKAKRRSEMETIPTIFRFR